MGDVMAFRPAPGSFAPGAAGAAAPSVTGGGEAGNPMVGIMMEVPPAPWAEIRIERPPEDSSSSPMPVRWTSRISRRNSSSSKPVLATAAAAFSREPPPPPARLRLLLAAMGEVRDESAQCERIALDAEALEGAQCGAG